MPRHPGTVALSKFSGLNNRHSPVSTPQTYLKKAENIDISSLGQVSKRKGYTKVISGEVTSLWASENGLGCYAVIDSDLVRVFDDFTTHTIKIGVGKDLLSFIEIDEVIYYVSKSIRGAIYNGEDTLWGINKNTLSPTLSIGTGTLPKGTYQVSFTYVAKNGIESGAGLPSVITVPEGSSINITIPPNNLNGIISSRIYCSTPDGTTLYYVGNSPLNTTFSINSVDSKRPFRLFNVDAPPNGEGIAYYNGRVYITEKNVIWYSEPFQYHHFDLGYNFIEFPEDVIAVLPVEGGLWVCSDKIYYLSGNSPEEFKRSIKEPVKMVKGTATRISGSYLHIENTPVGYKWLITTNLGIFVLFNQGLIINLTSQNIDLDKAESGGAVLLKDNGNIQYLTILKKEERPNNTRVGDLVEAQIVRNGVLL